MKKRLWDYVLPFCCCCSMPVDESTSKNIIEDESICEDQQSCNSSNIENGTTNSTPYKYVLFPNEQPFSEEMS